MSKLKSNQEWKVAHVVDEDGHLNVYITKGKKDNIITISTGQGDGDNGEQYALRFTTTNIEAPVYDGTNEDECEEYFEEEDDADAEARAMEERAERE